MCTLNLSPPWRIRLNKKVKWRIEKEKVVILSPKSIFLVFEGPVAIDIWHLLTEKEVVTSVQMLEYLSENYDVSKVKVNEDFTDLLKSMLQYDLASLEKM